MMHDAELHKTEFQKQKKKKVFVAAGFSFLFVSFSAKGGVRKMHRTPLNPKRQQECRFCHVIIPN